MTLETEIPTKSSRSKAWWHGTIAGAVGALLVSVTTWLIIYIYGGLGPYLILILIILFQVLGGAFFGGLGGIVGRMLPFKSAPWIIGAIAGVIGGEICRVLLGFAAAVYGTLLAVSS